MKININLKYIFPVQIDYYPYWLFEEIDHVSKEKNLKFPNVSVQRPIPETKRVKD